jgi:hypothetical protein
MLFTLKHFDSEGFFIAVCVEQYAVRMVLQLCLSTLVGVFSTYTRTPGRDMEWIAAIQHSDRHFYHFVH